MKRIIFFLMLCASVSCSKEAVVDDFIKFGILSVDNNTTYEMLSIELEGHKKQLPPADIKLVPGLNKLKIWGNTSTPTDKPVLIFDTLLNVTAEGTHKFVLFQTDPALRPTVLINNQVNEPKPEPGFMKIKIINMASNCFPGTVDLLMKMLDYNYGDLVDVDVIKSVKATYGEYEIYKTLDNTISDGGLYFIILDPATQEPLSTDFIYGPNLLNSSTGHFYNVLTLYLSEKESATGAFTGKNGKQYEVEVKALFSN